MVKVKNRRWIVTGRKEASTSRTWEWIWRALVKWSLKKVNFTVVQRTSTFKKSSTTDHQAYAMTRTSALQLNQQSAAPSQPHSKHHDQVSGAEGLHWSSNHLSWQWRSRLLTMSSVNTTQHTNPDRGLDHVKWVFWCSLPLRAGGTDLVVQKVWVSENGPSPASLMACILKL